MKKILLVLIAIVLHCTFVNAQCNAVTSGVPATNGRVINAVACGTTSASVDVPKSGYAQLNGLVVGAVYNVNMSGTSGANQITVRTATSGGTVNAYCNGCTSVSFIATTTTAYVVPTQSGCPGTWSTTSASINYSRLGSTPTATSTVTDETCPASNNGAIDVTLSGGLSNVRYIRINQNKTDCINLAEVEAIEIFTGTNVAQSKTVTGSADYDAANFPKSELVNGVKNVTNDMWHSQCTAGQWCEIDLGAAYTLDVIKIWNRSDCCWDRANNFIIELKNASGTVIERRQINAHVANSGTPSYDFNVVDASWSPTKTSLDLTGQDAGTYTLSYSDISGCGTISHAKTINTTKSESVAAATATASSTNICNGASTTLSVTGGTLGTGASWKWYTGSCGGTLVGTGSGATGTLAVSPTTNTTYFARAEGDCNNTTCQSVAINVFAQPVAPTLNVKTPSSSGFCAGSSVSATFNAGSGGTGAVDEYQISIDGGISWSSYTPGSSVSTIGGTGSAIIQGRRTAGTGTGCNATAWATLASWTLNPVPILTASIDHCAMIASGNKDNVILTVSSGTPNYTFSGPGTTTRISPSTVPTSSTISVFQAPIGGSSYTFTVTDANTCTGTASATTNTALFTTISGAAGAGTTTADCYLKGFNDWVHFKQTTDDDKLLLSIKDNNNDLGLVTVNAYVESGLCIHIPRAVGMPCTNPQATLKRHFRIQSTNPPSSNVDVRLYFTAQELLDLQSASITTGGGPGGHDPDGCLDDDDVLSINDLYVTKYSGANEDDVWSNNTAFPTGLYRLYGNAASWRVPDGSLTKSFNGFNTLFGGSTNHHYVELSVSEFSEFWIHGSENGAVLPVEMISFDAQAVGQHIELKWATALEIENKGFEVQRSIDAFKFEKIGWVDGQGNSTVQNNYRFTDNQVEAGVVYYYRLRQVDFNGTSELTDIVSESVKSAVSTQIGEFVPNPANATTTISIVSQSSNNPITISILNSLGQEVQVKEVNLNKGNNVVTFNVEELPVGTYVATIFTENKRIAKKLVVSE